MYRERELPSAVIHGKYICIERESCPVLLYMGNIYIYIERELPSAVIHGKYICIERESCPVLLYMANIYI